MTPPRTSLSRGFEYARATAALLVLVSLAACKSVSEEPRPEPCSQGEAGCECYPNSTCDDGFECLEAVCRSAVSGAELTLRVTSPDARACDILLRTQEARRIELAFDPGVRGDFLKRPPRMGASFVAREDQALVDGVAQLRSTDSDSVTVIIEKSTCYDRLGRPLSDARVTIE